MAIDRKTTPLLFFIMAGIALGPTSLRAQASPPSDSPAPGRILMEKMVEKLRSQVNVGSYQMDIEKPDFKRTLKLKVWDDRGKNRLFIRILSPTKEAGIGFLRLGNNLWSYLPKVERVLKIPPSLMLQPWMGSDFSNDDLVKESSFLEDYSHQIRSEEKQGDKTIVTLELTPKPKAPVVWGKVIFKVWREENLPLEQTFYSEKGELLKTLSFQDFKTIDGVLMPTRWEMKNHKKENQHSTLKTLEIDFNPKPPLPEWIFSQQNLTKIQ